MTKEIVCPKCKKAESIIPIIYSCSAAEYVKYQALEKEGKVLLAGCVLSVERPKYYCKACKFNIWDEDLK
jgi:hypothetical protein